MTLKAMQLHRENKNGKRKKNKPKKKKERKTNFTINSDLSPEPQNYIKIKKNFFFQL